MKNSKEYFQFRKQKREDLEDNLPIDKQLDLGDKNKEKEKRSSAVFWRFDESLFKRRNSLSLQDQLFFQNIKENLKQEKDPDYKKDIQKLSQLEKETQKEKQEIVEYLLFQEQIQEGLDECAQEGRWDDYVSLFKTAKQAGIEIKSPQEQIQKGLDECAQEGWWDDYVSLFKTAKQAGIEIKPPREQTQKGLDKYAQEGQWDEYVSLFKAAKQAGIEIKLFQEQIQKGLDKYAQEGQWDEYASLFKTANEVGIIDFHNLTFQKPIQELERIINKHPEEDQNYLNQTIINHLRQDKNLKPVLGSEYYDNYLSSKEASQEWNQELPANKRVKDVDLWWQEHSREIANLQMLDPEIAINFVNSHKDKGLPLLENQLNIFAPVLNDFEFSQNIREFIQTKKEKNDFREKDLDDLLQITRAYQKLNKDELFFQLLTQEKNNPEWKQEINNRLLKEIATSLDIELDKLPPNALDGWNIEYLANLSTNEEIIKQWIERGVGNYENVLELYKEMLKSTFEGRFNEFITFLNQSSEVGQDVARHNQKNAQAFADLDIDWQNWLNYTEIQNFSISSERKVDNTKFLKDFLEKRVDNLKQILEDNFKDKLSPREYEPLMHILGGTKKKKSIANIFNYSELKKELNNLKERINNLKQKIDPETKQIEYSNLNWSLLEEHFSHLEEAIDNFKEKKQTTETVLKNFRVKLWDRDPKKDFFQGNYTHCCIAVGVKEAPAEGGLNTHDPATVMHFLADQGIQVAEVLEESKKDPIAQVWLFVSCDDNGEPILVVDNFKVNKNYTNESYVNNMIRDNMFKFLADFAKKINIPKAGIAMVGTNDVDLAGFKTLRVSPVNKVGGYLKDYTSSSGDRVGRYYLEAYNHTGLAQIYQEQHQSQKVEQREEAKQGKIIVLNKNDELKLFTYTPELQAQILNGERTDIMNEKKLQQLERIEAERFSEDEASDLADLQATLLNTQGIQMFFQDNNNLIAYLASKPAIAAQENFTQAGLNDPDFRADPNTLYIESIAGDLAGISPKQIIETLKQEAQKAGYEKIGMHGINKRLNKILSRYGFKKKRDVKNWLANKDCEYLELELD